MVGRSGGVTVHCLITLVFLYEIVTEPCANRGNSSTLKDHSKDRRTAIQFNHHNRPPIQASERQICRTYLDRHQRTRQSIDQSGAASFNRCMMPTVMLVCLILYPSTRKSGGLVRIEKTYFAMFGVNQILWHGTQETVGWVHIRTTHCAFLAEWTTTYNKPQVTVGRCHSIESPAKERLAAAVVNPLHFLYYWHVDSLLHVQHRVTAYIVCPSNTLRILYNAIIPPPAHKRYTHRLAPTLTALNTEKAHTGTSSTNLFVKRYKTLSVLGLLPLAISQVLQSTRKTTVSSHRMEAS